MTRLLKDCAVLEPAASAQNRLIYSRRVLVVPGVVPLAG
jgi:hypothetical protein